AGSHRFRPAGASTLTPVRPPGARLLLRGRDESGSVSEDRGLHPVLGSQLRQDRTDIALDGALSEIELLRHLGVRPPRAEESQDLAFPGRERPDGLLRSSIGLRPRPE